MLVNYELAADVHTSHRHVVELGFSVLLAEIRRHCVGWFPAFLAFRHAPPHDMRGHERLLGTHPLFNADRNYLLLDSAVLSNPFRSEERRVGKEGVSRGRSRWAPDLLKNKQARVDRMYPSPKAT